MTVTYNEILKAAQALKKLAQKELNIKTAVNLARLIKKLDGELEVFNDKYRELLEKYGKENDEGGYSIPKEKQKEFSENLTQLINVEIEIDGGKINIEDDIKIEPAIILDAESFVEFKTE